MYGSDVMTSLLAPIRMKSDHMDSVLRLGEKMFQQARQGQVSGKYLQNNLLGPCHHCIMLPTDTLSSVY